MGSPSSSLATLRPDLGGSLEEFDLEMDRRGFIAVRCMPVIDSAKKSGTFGVIPVEQLLQTRSTRRTPGAGYSRGSWTFAETSYACEEHGAEEPVDDSEAEMYREFFDAEVISAARAQDIVLRNAEIRAAALLFNATTFASQLTTLTNEWDDATNATPIADINAAVKAIWDRCGLWANALIINRHVFRNLRICDEIKDAVASSGAGDRSLQTDITAAKLGEVLDLPHILVAGSAKNTGAEGQAASIAPLWSDEYAMVARVAETNDIREPCIARTIHWSADGSQIGGTVETYRDETVRSDIVRNRHDVDELTIHTESAQLLDNVTT
jgi:hypothetical protein